MTVRLASAGFFLLLGAVPAVGTLRYGAFALVYLSCLAVGGYAAGGWFIDKGRSANECLEYSSDDWASVRSDYLWALYIIGDAGPWSP
jgi:hypothetical protein